jgi:hypothetical protein
MERMSMDIKSMPKSVHSGSDLLVMTCEITNWCVATPLTEVTAVWTFREVFARICCVFGTPKVIISDQGSNFTADFIRLMYSKLGIKPYVVSPSNHGANRTERYIRTLNDRIRSYLIDNGSDWPYFVPPCLYAMNTFVSPVTGFSPYEMVFIRKPPPISMFEIDTEVVRVAPAQYLERLKKEKKMLQVMIMENRLRQQKLQKRREEIKSVEYPTLGVNDLVMMKRPGIAALRTDRKNVSREWVGPLKIQTVLGPNKYLVADLYGYIQPTVLARNELKPYYYRDLSSSDVIRVITDTKDLIRTLRGMQASTPSTGRS